jgi:hypothetical protein
MKKKFLGFCFEGGFERVSLNAIFYSATSSPDVESLYIHITIQLLEVVHK